MEKNNKLKFCSPEHEEFYYKQANCTYNDCYHRALIYALGITENIRNHFSQVYDINADRIKPNFKDRAWVTSTDARTLKLAFNLFNDGNKCDVSEAFSFDGMAEYYLQAIALRYEVIMKL